MLTLSLLQKRLFGCASGFPPLPQTAFAAPHCAKRLLAGIRRVALSLAPLHEPTRVGPLDGRARRSKRLGPPSRPQLFAGIPPRVLAPPGVSPSRPSDAACIRERVRMNSAREAHRAPPATLLQRCAAWWLGPLPVVAGYPHWLRALPVPPMMAAGRSW